MKILVTFHYIYLCKFVLIKIRINCLGSEDIVEHLKAYFEEVKDIVDKLDLDSVRGVLSELADLKDRQGRLFILGVGGSAGNASHAVNDFRKLCGIEAYAPTDNVSELTARTNDEGWAFVFRDWLKVSSLNNQDLILIFSVGGGNEEKKCKRQYHRSYQVCTRKK